MLKTVIVELNGVILDDNKEASITPYVVELLKDLHNHGIKLLVLSSLAKDELKAILASLHVDSLIDDYITMEGINPGNDSTSFLHNMYQPQECILVTASQESIHCANSIGITCIGYSNPNSQKQNLWKAAMLVEGFEEIDYEFLNEVYQKEHQDIPKTILVTDRLEIRELTISDFDALYTIYQEPTINRFLENYSNDYHLEKAKLAAYIQNIYQYYGFGLWGVFTKEDNQLIGQCGIELKQLKDTSEYEIGYLIRSQSQGKGYGRECMNAVIHYGLTKLGASRIVAVIDKKNISSINFAKSIGMQYKEDIIRNHITCAVYEKLK